MSVGRLSFRIHRQHSDKPVKMFLTILLELFVSVQLSSLDDSTPYIK